MILPLRMIMDRVEKGRSDSDTTFFMDLLYAGEMVQKLTVSALVSAMVSETEGHKYRIIHRLVRADGIGEWSQSLDDVLTGPASHAVHSSFNEDRRVLTERVGPGSWQHEAVSLLQKVLERLSTEVEPIPGKVALRTWFAKFPELRNKTRAHGAPTPQLCADSAPDLEASIKILVDNSPIFKREWAYLHRNLSGKYRVLDLGNGIETFDVLKSAAYLAKNPKNLQDGIYVFSGEYSKNELLKTDVDLADFWFPNGAFNGKTFEFHSLITDSRRIGDAAPYLAPASERPSSETEGADELDIIGNVYCNLPPRSTDYIPRTSLEENLKSILKNDRHAIVTLVGRGGIGKTSLALNVLYNLTEDTRFDSILWFSARDIDLISSGAKVVKPHVLSETDIANEFVRLTQPKEAAEKGFKALACLSEAMSKVASAGCTLFVFDNFETVRSPVDLFNWIDTNIRLPNKILITTRFRDFRADYPIEIPGMERPEADILINKTAEKLGISAIISDSYRDIIFDESDGHPYIMKIVLGEIGDTRKSGKPERIVARKDEILDALFERTYIGLTPGARRVFLTLCGWRSLVPQLALEAVLLRPESDRMDVAASVDELIRMSLIQRAVASDGTDFLDVPLVAAVFGQKKLGVSPIRPSVESDLQMLREIGPTTETSLNQGLRPKIERLYRYAAKRLSERKVSIAELKPVLELISRNYAPGWLLLADLYEEDETKESLLDAAEAVRRFLETDPDIEAARPAWERLASIYRRSDNFAGAADAYVRFCSYPDTSPETLSNVAHWLNNNRLPINSDDPLERNLPFEALIKIMEPRLKEGDANYLSRLAWLHLHVGDSKRARELAEMGLGKDPDHRHSERLVRRLEETAS